MKKIAAFMSAAALALACTRPVPTPTPIIDIDPVPLLIDISIDKVGEKSVDLTITPNYEDALYIILTVEKSYFEKFASDEEYFQDDIRYFAEWALSENSSLSSIIEGLSTSGTQSLSITTLEPETEYYAYAYGITLEGIRTSPIYKAEYKTLPEPGPEMIEMSFGLGALVTGTDAEVFARPDRNDVMYLFDVLSPADIASEGGDMSVLAAKQMQLYIDRYAFGDVSVADVVEGMCSLGPDSYVYNELDQLTEYTAFACAFDRKARVCSNIETYKFTTGEVVPSDNLISITIDEITSTTVKASFNCTNDDKYLYQIEKLSDFALGNDEEYMKYWINYYAGYLDWVTEKGSTSYEFIDLDPDTDYVVFAFGEVSRVPTTALNKVLVHTLAEGGSNSAKKLIKKSCKTDRLRKY